MRIAQPKLDAAMRPAHSADSRVDQGDDADGLQSAVSGDRGSPLWPGFTRLESIVQPVGLEVSHVGTVFGGGQRSSGSWSTDGGTVGASGSGESYRGPGFDRRVPANGYAWWYVDALSDDGQHGITLIAFIGSVFSPYYAHARRCGNADPLNHCAINVALYGPRGKRWAMTERGCKALSRQASTLAIGPSAVRWDGNALVFQIDEITFPLPSRLRGQIRLIPHALVQHIATLDTAGMHHWQPVAPSAHVDVQLDSPDLRWSGEGYWDSNFGDEPLEKGIRHWHWSRAKVQNDTAVIYDVTERNGRKKTLATRFGRSGKTSEFEAPAYVQLPASGWRIKRATRSEDGAASIVRTMEDTPFYARSVTSSRLFGETTTSMHESLDLDRFRSRIVQLMLPFRMPRRRR